MLFDRECGRPECVLGVAYQTVAAPERAVLKLPTVRVAVAGPACRRRASEDPHRGRVVGIVRRRFRQPVAPVAVGVLVGAVQRESRPCVVLDRIERRKKGGLRVAGEAIALARRSVSKLSPVWIYVTRGTVVGISARVGHPIIVDCLLGLSKARVTCVTLRCVVWGSERKTGYVMPSPGHRTLAAEEMLVGRLVTLLARVFGPMIRRSGDGRKQVSRVR